jgi:predicted unusual protein kinase regulating ubiquinone biosynthesis (AarF/ABC1/UbiB family)
LKTLNSIPTKKIARATKLVTTGAKVGRNYIRYYGEKLLTGTDNKSKLDENNAKDIYDGLKELRGSALKVAQMLSMEKSLMPQAYVEQFGLSQFSVPPLSGALVKKIIRKYLGDDPEVLFDVFSFQSVNAASIGQVHRAEKDGKKLAIKIQYPGVSNSISSDLAIVKPIALKMFNLRGKDTDRYFREVEEKLLEETDYLQEIKHSQFISDAAKKKFLVYVSQNTIPSGQQLKHLLWIGWKGFTFQNIHLKIIVKKPEINWVKPFGTSTCFKFTD